MSQRAPGYRFQYQVPPTSSASSNTSVVKPALRNRCRRYRPANPAPTTATSTCCVVAPLVASERDAATIASGMPSSRAFYFAVGYSRASSLSSGQFQSSVAARAAHRWPSAPMDRVHFTSGRALPLLARFGIELEAELGGDRHPAAKRRERLGGTSRQARPGMMVRLAPMRMRFSGCLQNCNA